MTTGIVCEYNPFHNGHLYQIEQAKALGSKNIVCVMSGNFVQRGECAFFEKYLRAKAAVLCGADVVIDLPTPWAVASAETFARGSIGLLRNFGIDALSFGCESDDEKLLSACAEKMNEEETGLLIRSCTAKGMSYPQAVSKVLCETLGNKAGEIVASPNNTLAIEYIRHLPSDIRLLPVKRTGADHDSDIAEDNIASASMIRKSGINEESSAFIPEKLMEFYKNAPVYSLIYSERAILSALRFMKKEEYSLYVSDNSGLDMRIYESTQAAGNLESLYNKAKSKNYTHSRIRREVLNLYLKVKREYSEGIPPYIKVLAVSEKGISLLSEAKKHTSLPIITKYSEAKNLRGTAKEIYDVECRNTDLFSLCTEKIKECGFEKTHSLIIVK